jgi:signal transduction histidine kinase
MLWFAPQATMFASRRWTFGVLLTLTGVSFAALLSLGWRSLDRFAASFTEVLHDACVQAAGDAADRIQREFKSSIFNLLEQVDHTAIKNGDTAKIAPVLAKRSPEFPQIDSFFIWGHPTEDGASNKRESDVMFYPFWRKHETRSRAGPPDSFYPDPAMSSMLIAQARKIAPPRKVGDDLLRKNWNFALLYLTVDNHVYHAIFHFLYDDRGPRDLRGFEGFFTDIGRLREEYFPRFVSSLVPPRGNTRSVAPIVVSIVDDGGREVARTGRSLAHSFEAEERFPLLFFDMDLFDSIGPYRPEVRYWTVRTGYEHGTAPVIAAAGTRQQRWTWVLVGLIGAIGVGSIGWAASRQAQLARMQKEFVASISHDLKTPLAKIQLFAETLESGHAAPQKAETYHRRIRVQAGKLSQLIAALLDFSRYESSASYTREEIDLRAVLANSLELVEDDLALQRVTLDLRLPDGEVPILGNSQGLQQVFSNLISNALKYSPHEPFLRVALSVADGRARIEFVDHGLGVGRRERRKIFRRFYRGLAAGATAASGSGIGLAIVDEIVRAHGGAVSVKSEVGAGSTFTVEVPVLS